MRKCGRCSRTKRPGLFFQSELKLKRLPICKACWKKGDTYRRNRSKYLRRTYGLTLEDYEVMLECQNGGCALCGKKPGKRALAVDHNHRTGAVRGLLCQVCNQYLGHIKDDPQVGLYINTYLLEPK